LALLAAGCGLADYEAKMREADARVQRFDEENKALDEPLTIPTVKEKETNRDVPLADLFLRPPKGIAKNGKWSEGSSPPLYYYPAASAGVCTDVYLIFGDAKQDRDKFRGQVEALLHAPQPPPAWQPRSYTPPGRPPRTFDVAEFAAPANPPTAPAVYVAAIDGGGSGVAVVFRMEQAKRKDADAAVTLSLESFAAGPEAQQARAAYGRRAGR
jgi:hypothetical protein